MSKKKAIEICRNLEQTIQKMGNSVTTEHRHETYEIPRAHKNRLVSIKRKLIEKYGKL
jgi:hypothetical protein